MIQLNQDKYKEFLKTLGAFASASADIKDLDMQNGLIRTSSNQNGTMYFVDCTTLVGKLNLRLAELKNKLDILKIFSKSDVVSFEKTDDDGLLVKDKISQLKIEPVIYEMFSNKFKDVDADSLFDMNKEILTFQITSDISNRLNVLISSFGQQFLKAKFIDDKCVINVKSSSGEYDATLVEIPTKIKLNTIIDIPTSLFSFSFNSDTNPIELLMTYDDKNGIVNVRVQGTVGDSTFGKLYARSRVV